MTDYLAQALELAQNGYGLTSPNPMVGAILVQDKVVIGTGFHRGAGLPHAEVEAFADAAKRGNMVAGAELFVTLEPCSTFGRTPPCTDKIIAEKVTKVTIGTIDPNPAHAGNGIKILSSAGIAVEIAEGKIAEACRKLNAGFFHRMASGKPLVLLKLALTLDGKIATVAGESKWITGCEARERVQYLRRGADAILVGSDTFKLDAPRLTRRDADGNECLRQARRLVASRQNLTIPGFETVNITDWNEFLLQLGQENCNMLLIEGGGELAASALKAQAVDQVEFHYAPKILGGKHSRPAVGGKDPLSLTEAIGLKNMEILPLGEDFAVTGLLK